MKIQVNNYEYEIINCNNSVNFSRVDGKEYSITTLRFTLKNNDLTLLELNKLRSVKEDIILTKDDGKVETFSGYELTNINKNYNVNSGDTTLTYRLTEEINSLPDAEGAE